MRILVTGRAGLIGSKYSRYVLHAHPEYGVVNLGKLAYAGKSENLAEVRRDARHSFGRGDVCDESAVRSVIADVDVVINLVAKTHVVRSILDAGAFLDSDIKGIYVLLEAARHCGIERILHVSTDEVYGSLESGSFTEAEQICPSSPHVASKAGGELIAWSCAHLRIPDSCHEVLEHVRTLPVRREGCAVPHHERDRLSSARL